MKWGAMAGFSAVKNSTFSLLQNGKIEQPLPMTFVQLGIMNERLHRREYGTIPDIKLRTRVQAQEAICTPEGRPWGAVEFFAHFMGQLPPPDWVLESPEPSEQEADQMSRLFVSLFQETASQRMLSPIDAWSQLSLYCGHLSKPELDKLRNVLSGWHTFTPQELVALGNGEAGSKVLRALTSWKNSEEP